MFDNGLSAIAHEVAHSNALISRVLKVDIVGSGRCKTNEFQHGGRLQGVCVKPYLVAKDDFSIIDTLGTFTGERIIENLEPRQQFVER
jgi:hypothetical protein